MQYLWALGTIITEKEDKSSKAKNQKSKNQKRYPKLSPYSILYCILLC